ncbi:MAG: Hsp70 family protein [Lachnospiraceae bacterium]|nr:Hsp70 family protein [Lachnospiraceae bacterium]
MPGNFISELFHRDLVCGSDAQVLVAKGIGYYVGIKQREEGIGEIVMTDVCPFSLGTGVIRDNDPSLIMNVLIKRNSKLPKSVTERYFPVSASQDRVEFDIYQGEHYHAEDNQKLGEFEIRIPQGGPMAQKEIKVTMAYDINGILYVQAENAEGRKVDYIVDGQRGMTPAQIREMSRALLEKSYLPREAEECTYLLECAMHLYEQANDDNRNFLEECIAQLVYAKSLDGNVQSIKIVRECKKMLEAYMAADAEDPFEQGEHGETEIWG